jgi:hypothetical protein
MTPLEKDNIGGQKLALFIFECVMSVLYLIMGIVFLFTSHYSYVIQGGFRTGLGAILSFYGIFRVYIAIRKMITRRNG